MVKSDVKGAERTTWTTGVSLTAGRTTLNQSPPTQGPTFILKMSEADDNDILVSGMKRRGRRTRSLKGTSSSLF